MSTTTKKSIKKSIAKPRAAKSVQPEPEISELGKKLREIRARIEASGVPLLTSEEIDQISNKIISSLTANFGAILRSI